MVQRFGLTIAGLSAAILVFGVAGNAAAGLLADRLGPLRLVALSFVGPAAAFGLLLLPLPPVGAALALGVCAFMGTLFATPQQGRLVHGVPADQHGLVLALNSSASYVGIAGGAALASVTVVSFGVSALPLVALGCLALAIAVDALARGSKAGG
ncbi:MAG: hypothetical protein ACU0CI_15195 [Shimia sp.]